MTQIRLDGLEYNDLLGDIDRAIHRDLDKMVDEDLRKMASEVMTGARQQWPVGNHKLHSRDQFHLEGAEISNAAPYAGEIITKKTGQNAWDSLVIEPALDKQGELEKQLVDDVMTLVDHE